MNNVIVWSLVSIAAAVGVLMLWVFVRSFLDGVKQGIANRATVQNASPAIEGGSMKKPAPLWIRLIVGTLLLPWILLPVIAAFEWLDFWHLLQKPVANVMFGLLLLVCELAWHDVVHVSLMRQTVWPLLGVKGHKEIFFGPVEAGGGRCAEPSRVDAFEDDEHMAPDYSYLADNVFHE